MRGETRVEQRKEIEGLGIGSTSLKKSIQALVWISDVWLRNQKVCTLSCIHRLSIFILWWVSHVGVGKEEEKELMNWSSCKLWRNVIWES
jgi:hypothetical protein